MQNKLGTLGHIEIYDEKLHSVIDAKAPIQVLGNNFAWTEGPAWDPLRQCLYFSDIPNNRIHRWCPSDGVTTVLDPAGRIDGDVDPHAMPGTNGLWVTDDDLLLVCNQDARSVDQINLATMKRSAIATSFDNLKFNSPNDVIRSSKGHVYFTDPPFGLKDQGNYTGMESDIRGVYRVSRDGDISVEARTMTFPNGLNFNPDETCLYVSQSDHQAPIIMKFDVDEAGFVINGAIFYDSTPFCEKGDPGLPDGMTVNRNGHVFATVAGGVAILSPEGKLLGRIATGKATANCTFGENGSTLFITAHETLLRVETKTMGVGF